MTPSGTAPPAPGRPPRRRRLRGAAPVIALALARAAGGGAGGGSPPAAGDAAGGAAGGEGADDTAAAEGAYPVEIEHRYGTTTIESEPERIVTVGLTDQDAAIALGFVPVGITQWFDTHEHGVGPWAEDLLGDAEPEVLDNATVNAEQIAALQPDPILALYSALTEDEYEALSQLAPVVAQPGEYVDYGIPWQDQTRTIGRALGRAGQADALVADVEQQFAAVVDQHPEFAGAVGVVATPYQGTVSVYAPQDTRGRFLADLGFVPFDGLEEMAGDQFAVEISDERLDLLDVDALVWILGDDVDADMQTLHDEPVYGGLEVAAEGREVGVSNFSPLGEATSFQTVVSLPFLLDGMVPMLAAAVDGDPTTPVDAAG
jgi:iron complex transport system substrate-binding protein